ncbi:MAG: universal stress protein [Syntrophomonadaceae bacterium]
MVIEKLLLATDFSQPAMHLLDCLPELKAVGLKEVVLLHVIDRQNPAKEASYIEITAQEILDGLKAKCDSMGLLCRPIVARGIPSAEIAAAASRENGQLILISPHSKGKIKEFLLGSTTAEVLRLSPVPVLINKAYPVDPLTGQEQCFRIFQKVLIPLDFSPHSLAMLGQVQDLAALIQEVILLNVVEGDFDTEELIRTVENRQILITSRKNELDRLGLKVRTMVHQGPAGADILAVAEKEDVTLIMLATRGEGMVKEFLLGSTANEVTRQSKRPVLIFPEH